MGLPGVRLHAIHLRLPGHGGDGPTLELFGLAELLDRVPSVPNRPGLMHVAFAVDDIRKSLERVVEAGGETLGSIAKAEVAGVGWVEFLYCRDPEGNIVELQEFK
jgi:glyoxylase I family protein